MLFIHHDEAEVGEGQEQRRAGADHDLRALLGHGAEGGAAHGGGEFGMPDRRGGAEAGGEALQELDGEGDFRQQDQGLAAGGDGGGDGFQIHLGLAGAGDAVEQRDGEGLRGDGGAKGGGGGGLRGGERGGGVRWVGGGEAELLAAFGLDQEIGFQTEGQHVAAFGQGVVRHPVDELAQLLRQRRQVEDFGDWLGADGLVRRVVPHRADDQARAERHAHQRTGGQGFRCRVGEGGVEWIWQQHGETDVRKLFQKSLR